MSLPSDHPQLTHSVWQQGANAARAGKPITANPYSKINWNYVVWMNGWATATHNMAKQEIDEL